MANVLIVEDHPVVFEGLQKLLIKRGIASHCYPAYTAEECRRLLKSITPDIILMDYNLPDGNGIDLCEEILRKDPEMRILAISSFREQSLVLSMIKTGALGYVLKNAMEEEIIEAVTSVLNGNKYLCEKTTELLSNKDEVDIILTRRELEVLKLISEGCTNSEIAEQLFISPLTVTSHRKNLILKLNAKNTASLITIAIKKNLIHVENY